MSAEEFRRHAENCLKILAALPPEHGGKAHLFEMACAWHRLADQIENDRNADRTCGTLTSPAQKPK